MALENMKNHFSGLPMDQLIGGPLTAACDSQLRLARATAEFIETAGFYKDADGVSRTKTADFSFDRSVIVGKDALGHDIYESEAVSLKVPMLSIVNVPSLMIDKVDISFDMEVKSSETHVDKSECEASLRGSAQVGWGPFSAKVEISGSVSSSSENTRSSDNSAKYHVQVQATDSGMSEGLSRVLDIVAGAVAPNAVEGPQARADRKIANQLEPLAEKKKQLTNQVNRKQLEIETKKRELGLITQDDEQAEAKVANDRESIPTHVQTLAQTG